MDWLFLAVLGAVFTLMVLVTKFYQRLRHRHYNVPARDIRKGHRWCMMDVFPRPTYCNVSEHHIVDGAVCDSCGTVVADQYMRDADLMLRCKELSNTSTNEMKHQWIKGNLPLCCVCAVCSEQCGDLPQLCDFRCCWCERTVHERCKSVIGEYCDLGQFCRNIIPPTCIRLKLVGVKGRRRVVVESARESSTPNWKPLIVMANRKSGNGDADQILRCFRALLNPVQVVDLFETSPECALEWCHLLPNVTWQVLVAGGDGTVGWVLSSMDKLALKMSPELYILPHGTGNDLSRVLGWGEGYTGDVPVRQILEQMSTATVVKLDRWQLEIIPEKHFGIRMPTKKLIMNNYASIGVDALVALNFHHHRQSRPSLFGSRLINKFWYFTYGTRDLLERECKNLDKKLKVSLDDRVIDLPAIEGIVILNIASWGGGCRPWTARGTNGQNIPECRYDDGLLEVFALYSSFHIAQLQVGLAEPLRLGQAKVVKINLEHGNAPMQVDGEPWLQHPGTIIITYHNQASLLANE